MNSLDSLLIALRGVSESTRLRIVSVLVNGELTVSELTGVLEQSQPRVSRHLKLLSDAGVIERHQEGAWVFYRLADHPLVDLVRRCIPRDDRQIQQDLARLEALHRDHRERAARYFRQVAGQWDRIRGKGLSERDVESRIMQLLGDRAFRRHVDLGTGTGRMLQLLAARTRAGLGIDNSRDMLAVARVNLAQERYVHCQARHGDIRHPDVDDASSDLVTVHHVLHYLDTPNDVIQQAARILEPGGLLVVVDYAPHGDERLREESAHRRLGFEPDEVASLMREAGLVCGEIESFRGDGKDDMGVLIWTATQPAVDHVTAVH